MRPLSVDVRWGIVLTVLVDGLSAEKVRKRFKKLNIEFSMATVWRVLACYRDHNDVVKPTGPRRRLGAPAIDPIIDQKILDIFIEEPESTAMEAYNLLCEEHGLSSHYSTFCKAMHRLGFTHKMLRGYSQKRDAAAAHVVPLLVGAVALREAAVEAKPLRAVDPRVRRGAGRPLRVDHRGRAEERGERQGREDRAVLHGGPHFEWEREVLEQPTCHAEIIGKSRVIRVPG